MILKNVYFEYRYGNLLSPAKALTVTHEMFPNHFILSTEACEGKYDFFNPGLMLNIASSVPIQIFIDYLFYEYRR